ncbi:hypothetical protein [Bacillus andreraoultii]|nr:hypothetical protein [Bacillus andreraoultii]
MAPFGLKEVVSVILTSSILGSVIGAVLFALNFLFHVLTDE